MGSNSVLQGILLTQGSKPDLVNCRRILIIFITTKPYLILQDASIITFWSFWYFYWEKRRSSGPTFS